MKHEPDPNPPCQRCHAATTRVKAYGNANPVTAYLCERCTYVTYRVEPTERPEG